MAGYASSIVHNLYPAEFAAISRNLQTQQMLASQYQIASDNRATFVRRRDTIETEFMRPDKDRDADGHGYGAPYRRKREGQPPASVLELLAGEGSIIDERA